MPLNSRYNKDDDKNGYFEKMNFAERICWWIGFSIGIVIMLLILAAASRAFWYVLTSSHIWG